MPASEAPRKAPDAPERKRGLRAIPWHIVVFRVRKALKEGRRRTESVRLLRDVLGALLLVGLLIGGVSLATGGAWPPMLVVESGSMMHPTSQTPYGRIGTIDVGDVHFVSAVKGADDVELWVDGGKEHFGRPGDVIAFSPGGNRTNITIIHRAITWVDVVRLENGSLQYRMKWTDGEVKTFGDAGIYWPPLNFDEDFGFTPRRGYKPAHSGFLTKGDNPGTNPGADQALGITGIVHPTWIEGTVHGEVPWVGLGRLALRSTSTNQAVPGWERVGNAFAPVELWTMFFLVLALVILVPLSIDTHRTWREQRQRRRLAQRQAAMDERKQPAAFTLITK